MIGRGKAGPRRQWGSDRHLDQMPAAPRSVGLAGRLGFYYRARRHRGVPRARLDEAFTGRLPSLTVLIPSYQEEESVIRMTVLSAALQEYPDMRVVLLIDDPPGPRCASLCSKLQAARALPEEIKQLLLEPRNRFDLALMHYEEMGDPEREVTVQEIVTLAEHYEFAAGWINELVHAYGPADRSERFFVNNVLGQLGSDLALMAAALRSTAEDDPAKLPAARMAQLYRRLAWTFRAELSSFERKRYVSLSPDSNKAVNLNSYIGLIGGRYSEQHASGRRALVPVEEGPADLVVPHSDYVVTLDADTVIVPEYCLQLVYLLERGEMDDVAVARAPCSAYPGAATRGFLRVTE